MTNSQLWQTILGELEVMVSRANFITWFQKTSLDSKDKNQITVAVPNAFTKEWLENKYNKLILKSLQNLYPQIRSVNYIIKTVQAKDIADYQESYSEETKPFISSELNPKYHFDNFVVGFSNEMAFTAAKAIAKGSGENNYNPLFIYGSVGLGKTHLMQAIGNELQNINKDGLKIKYATSERFTNDFIDSLRTKTTTAFKDKYRDNDILLIDDIQFIGPKEQTQSEFHHTFNSLHQNNKQVVLTSDRPPRDIQALKDRLRSRFEGGMLVDISKPDIETRLAILQEKQKQENIAIPDNVVEFIARNVTNNVRELEGALNKLIAYIRIREEIPSVKETSRLLSTLVKQPKKRTTTNQKILKAVSDFYGVAIKEIISRGRRQEIVKPRQIAIFLMRSECQSSYPSIGQQIGGRDHTTAIHSFKQIEEALRNNETLKQEIDTIKEKIYV